MKIALIGSAPSSIRLAPYGDTSWQIWACSPGAYPVLSRCDKFFELHRWEPGVIGQPGTQKPWFSPEYCLWMSQQKCVVMTNTVAQIPNSVRLDREQLINKYGNYNFTSSLAWMFAMALEEIDKAVKSGDTGPHAIGMWGVDMAATEEYGYQRSGCQFFIQIAHMKGIQVIVPPESDLLAPPMLYGVAESSPQMIKLTERKRELESRLNNCRASLEALKREEAFLTGAVDDNTYHLNTWIQDQHIPGGVVADFNNIFGVVPTLTDSVSPQKQKRKYIKRMKVAVKANGHDRTLHIPEDVM